jgi:hypothetical protein
MKTMILLLRVPFSIKKRHSETLSQNNYNATLFLGSLENGNNIQVFRNSANSDYPEFLIEVWLGHMCSDCFFAETAIALNYLLKELQTLIDIVEIQAAQFIFQYDD